MGLPLIERSALEALQKGLIARELILIPLSISRKWGNPFARIVYLAAKALLLLFLLPHLLLIDIRHFYAPGLWHTAGYPFQWLSFSAGPSSSAYLNL